MLLKLSVESNTAPVKLNQSELRPQRGDELYVIGFGDTVPGFDYRQPDRLHEVTVNYMTNRECLANSVYTQPLLTPMSMCAGDRGEDACSGDSGGPLIAKGDTDADDVLMGVVSWGWDCAVQPGVYARVSTGYNWIRDEVCRMSNNPPASFRCPAPPTNRPTAAPTHIPTNKPVTKLPTRAPTKRPTPEPTTRPSSFPSATSPSSIPSTEPSFLPTTPVGLSLLPSQVVSQQPTENPTRENNVFESDDDFLFESSEGKHQFPPFKRIQRRALPDGKSCASASMSSAICCSSLSSNNDDGTFGAPCFPSLHGGAFEGGMPCESASRAENNDPGSFDPEICNLLSSLMTDNTTAGSSSNRNTTGSEGDAFEGSILSVWGDRRYLPDGMSCSDLTDRTECCTFLDNRIPKSNLYHGQPCVAVRYGGEFPNSGGSGVCETANFVAEHAPGSAMDCTDAALLNPEQQRRPSSSLSSLTLLQQQLALDDDLKALQTQILSSRRSSISSTWNRTQLALDQPCQAITDPLVCCTARQAEQECTTSSSSTTTNRRYSKETKQTSWKLGVLGEKVVDSRSRSRTCLPKKKTTRLDSRVMHPVVVEVEISSHTSIPFSFLGDEQEAVVVSMVPTDGEGDNHSNDDGHHDDDDPCEVLLQDELRRRSPVKECSSLQQARSCCSAIESSTTQPCVFLVGQGCTSMEWVISNLSKNNATVIVDCAMFPESDAP